MLRDEDRVQSPKLSHPKPQIDSYRDFDLPVQIKDSLELKEKADRLFNQQSFDRAFELYQISLKIM